MTPKKKTRLRPAVLSLDARTLLSAGLSASLTHGLLTVQGTPGADAIVLNVVGRGGPNSTLVVQGVGRFKLGKVHAIAIDGGQGNDSVSIVDNGRAHLPARIVEGSGDVSIQGGSGADTILVGNGNDTISASSGSTITFGSGNDTINGVIHPAPVAPPAPAAAPAAPTPVATTPTTPVASAPVASTPVATTPVASAPVATTPTTSTTNNSPGSPAMPTEPATPVSTPPTTAQTIAQIFALTNADRVSNGLAPLTINARLMQAAGIEAGNMAAFQEMAHTIPGASDPTLQDRATAVGYNFTTLGENIAAYYPDAPSVETAWMASPDHRANILDGAFTQIGIAVAYDSNNEPYYSVEFGQPAN